MSPVLFGETLVQGILAFVATHLDDLLLLVVLFAQAQLRPRWRNWHIWLGAYLGLAGLMGISSLGYLGGLWLSPSAIGLLGLIPIAVGSWKLGQLRQETGIEKEIQGRQEYPLRQAWPTVVPLPVVTSMLLTFANGGDNISLYIPLFAGSTLLQIAIFSAIFFLMKAFWLVMAQKWAMRPAVTQVLAERGEHWAPWILIGLGVWILLENGAWG